MINGNRIKDVILEASKILDAACEEPLREARILMRECLQVDDAELILRLEAPCSRSVREQFSELVARRAKGEPMAYVVGHKEFMKLDFLVEKGILIPRPETETLCEWVIDHAPEKAKILDLFTGSGCVGISIAHTLEKSHVCCVDISKQALEMVKKNGMRLDMGKRVQTVQADLHAVWPFQENSFHVITANPPYIPTRDIAKLEKDVKEYEPHLALDGGEDGLAFYETIAKNAARILKTKGFLAVEIGIGQADDVVRIMKNYLVDVQVIEDLQNIPRVVVGYKKKPDYTGHRGRVKERAITGGLEHFQDYELMELLLFYTMPQKDTKPKAKELLREVGSISELIDMAPEDLMTAGKMTANGALLFSLIREVMRRYNREKWSEKPVLKTCQDVGRYAADNIPNEKVESFYVICLDTQRRVIKMVKVAKGAVDYAPVDKREVTRIALRTEAKSVILAHNHPSGDLNPSQADIELTQELVRALEANDIDVIDHVIVGSNGEYFSMEQGGFILQ